ncbi:MAG: hypothetical protein JWN66_2886 [Sphingomonas bacterium]|uniref:HAAS signaling domain-containing protein n=1 Tax=Sphingomonas bacterium TaxID=1895847 RepID=UPI00261875F1|nr:hypothetical protein [Sphingomonas bacterium]MDB5705770.1 hypothetical protein [Sphingomonas bacterium]
MDMIETYLDAVAAQLPRDTRDDIVAELRDTLLSQIEEREESLGRPLTDDERETVLRAMGHPLVVGARYREGPQQLIGPELFPYWMFAVKAGVSILALAFAVTFLVGLLGGRDNIGQAFGQSFSGLFSAGMMMIGIVTVAGAVMEHLGLRPAYFDHWRVKDLAVLRFGDPANWAAEMAAANPGRAGPFSGPRARHAARGRMWPGAEALGSVIWGLVFVAWWTGLFHIPGFATFGLHGEDVTTSPAPIWTALYMPILIYALAQVAVDALGVVEPAAVRVRAALEIPVALAGIVLVWIVLKAGDWVLLGRPGETATVRGGPDLLNFQVFGTLGRGSETLTGLAALLGIIFSWVLAGIAIGLAFKALKSAWRLIFA